MLGPKIPLSRIKDKNTIRSYLWPLKDLEFGTFLHQMKSI